MVLTRGDQTNQLATISAADGSVRTPCGCPTDITRVSVHPDGRRLAISAGSPEFEVWMIEKLVPVASALERQP